MITVYSKYNFKAQDFPVYDKEDLCQADMSKSIKEILENFVRIGVKPSPIPDSAYDFNQNDDDFDTEVSQFYVDPLDREAYKNSVDAHVRELEDRLNFEDSERESERTTEAKRSEEVSEGAN